MWKSNFQAWTWTDSALVKKALGGEVVFHSPYEAEVRDTALGAVRIEFDTLLFREMRVREFFAEFKLN